MTQSVSERRQRLLDLYNEGLSYKEIACRHGGTPHGVRSTIRKLRQRGAQVTRMASPFGGPATRIEWPIGR